MKSIIEKNMKKKKEANKKQKEIGCKDYTFESFQFFEMQMKTVHFFSLILLFTKITTFATI